MTMMRLRNKARLLSANVRSAFSLIEVLLAIFILGIGVISIAALFPAGIAQQRLSTDDMSGSMVADAAIAVIRSKVKPEWFGTFEEFTPGGAPTPLRSPRFTVDGDWTWLRPGFLFGDDPMWPPPSLPAYDETGAIDIFSSYATINAAQPPAAMRATEFPAQYQGSGLYGIPYNRSIFSSVPRILITQQERYYPVVGRLYGSNAEAIKPQYVWDCMFRRFQGKILVAIFVYRVTVPGSGTASNYVIAQAPNPCANVPPVPIHLNFINNDGTSTNWTQTNQDVSAGGPWSTFSPPVSGTPPPQLPNNAIVLGTQTGVYYNPEDINDGINTAAVSAWARQAWEQPRQWLIDQNNNLHRVLGQTRTDYDSNTGEVLVELTRPVASLPSDLFPPYYFLDRSASNTDISNTHVVTDIWYMPLMDANGVTLTPVYATVKEL